jgi:hypothetical protein
MVSEVSVHVQLTSLLLGLWQGRNINGRKAFWKEVTHPRAAKKQRERDRDRERDAPFKGKPPLTHLLQLGPTFTPPNTHSAMNSSMQASTLIIPSPLNRLPTGNQAFNTGASWGNASYPNHYSMIRKEKR